MLNESMRPNKRSMSEVSICNKALRLLGAGEILSMTQNSREADLCLQVYPEVRNELLASHHWSFATRFTSLAPFSFQGVNQNIAIAKACKSAGFSQAFRLPLNYLSVQRIVPDIPYALSEEQSLFCNATSVEAVLTVMIADTTVYPPLFIESLARRIAADLAVALANNARLETVMTERFLTVFEAAKLADAMQISNATVSDATDAWLEVR